METKELKIPDMVMSMLGVVPSDDIEADDINGKKHTTNIQRRNTKRTTLSTLH